MDLAGEEALAALEARVRSINAAAALVRTQQCRVDLARVLHCGAFSSARAAEAAAAAAAADERKPDFGSSGQAAPAAHSASHTEMCGAVGAAAAGECSHVDEAAAGSGYIRGAAGPPAAGGASGEGPRAAAAGNDATSHHRAAHTANGLHQAEAVGQQHAAGAPDIATGTASAGDWLARRSDQGGSAGTADQAGDSEQSGGHGAAGSCAADSGAAEAHGAARHVHDSGFATVSVRLDRDLRLDRSGLWYSDLGDAVFLGPLVPLTSAKQSLLMNVCLPCYPCSRCEHCHDD